MKKVLLLIFLLISINSFSQIKIDGQFNDWSNVNDTISDMAGDGINVDFIHLAASSDEDYLYLKLTISDTLNLQSNNNISLYIDTDNKTTSGTQINLIGAELIWNFGSRNGTFSGSSIRHQDLGIIPAPTVTESEFEIAISRKRFPIFSSDTIRLLFRETITGGDMIPKSGTVFSYVFDNKTHAKPDIAIEKEDSAAIRIMNYNVLFDGLTDVAKEAYFIRIFNAINPEIIAFNELFNTSAATVKSFLDQNLPTGNAAGWYTAKLDDGNVTASIYPILQNWLVYPGKRITASLIDLPPKYPKDLLVINAHLKCCDADLIRQDEVDAISAFIQDIKSTGGVINVPDQTPFILLGDLNLVGNRQQLETLITGNIVNTQLYGDGKKPDWDGTNLEDLLSSHTDDYFTYTWRDDFSNFYPGRLDYIIYTESVLDVQKHFTLDTEKIPQVKLQQNNIFAVDTKYASDHLPKVADFRFHTGVTVITPASLLNSIKIYPIPAFDIINIKLISEKVTDAKVDLFSMDGRLINSYSLNSNLLTIDVSTLATGSYIIKVTTEEDIIVQKIIKTN